MSPAPSLGKGHVMERDRRGDVFDALEALRVEIVEDSVEVARRRRQLARINRLADTMDSDALEISAILSAEEIERPA